MPGGVEPSNLGKVLWPAAGLTKGDLMTYVGAVAPALLRAVRDRPLTVLRCPDGIDAPSFFQKNTPAYAPDFVATVSLPAPSARRSVRYTLCNSRRTLLWLANQAALELHPWLSAVPHLNRPTHLVFDLDPPEGRFDLAVRTALATRDALRDIGLLAAVKTSGGKGVHLYAPLERRYPYGRVRDAALEVALEVERREPALATTEFRKADRSGRVLIDFGRNAPGAHVVAAYSPRARPGAPVSFPVRWDQLPEIAPEEFTIRTVPSILARDGDRWAALMPRPQRLPASLGKS